MRDEGSNPAREALTVTLAAVVAGVAVGALAWGVIITIQLASLLHVLTFLAQVIANRPL